MSNLTPEPAKIVDWTTLFQQRIRWKKESLRVVFTNGVFDLLHRGHIDYLWAARRLGDLLVVGVNTDASVKQFKDVRRPLIGENDRATVLASLRMVDWVTLFDQDTPLELIKELKPDVLVKGADYQEDEIVGAPEMKSWGGEVVRIPLTAGTSTTHLIQTILNRYR